MSQQELTPIEPQPQLDIVETFSAKISAHHFFELHNGKRSIHCPFKGCKLVANNKGRLVCPHEHGFSMDAQMLDFMISHNYFREQPTLEDLYLAFPLCKQCQRVSMGVSTNINYSTYGNVYFSCECKYNDKLLVSIGAEKLEQSTCPESVRKIAKNNFVVERFKTPPQSSGGNSQRGASQAPIKDNSEVVAQLKDF
jgi:hypothetical protein